MAAKILPSQERLRQLFDYAADTGSLRWRRRPESEFAEAWIAQMWNTNYAGQEAGRTKQERGYREVTFNKKSWLAHRLIWKWVHGHDPVMIDHINRVTSDNRLANLRECTAAQNVWNTSAQNCSSHGIKGLSRCRSKWQARIQVNGKRQHLGIFNSIAEAEAAYTKAAKVLQGEFAIS